MRCLIDTGPLVSSILARAGHHVWVLHQLKRQDAPLLTCEPVLTEAGFLLKRMCRDSDEVFHLLERGILEIGIAIQDHHADLRALIQRYRNRPMSLADACLVRMSELHPSSHILTFDSDFRIYRRHGNRVIPVLMPQ